MKKYKDIIGAVAFIGIIVAAVIFATTPKNQSANDNQAASISNVLLQSGTADAWTKGNPDAKVRLVEYSDFQCPACGAYWTRCQSRLFWWFHSSHWPSDKFDVSPFPASQCPRKRGSCGASGGSGGGSG